MKKSKLQEIALALLENYVTAQETVISEYSGNIEKEKKTLQQYKQEMICRINRAAQVHNMQPLVRCAECVHRKWILKADRCVIHDRTVKKSDFCSWGQWKERSE